MIWIKFSDKINETHWKIYTGKLSNLFDIKFYQKLQDFITDVSKDDSVRELVCDLYLSKDENNLIIINEILKQYE